MQKLLCMTLMIVIVMGLAVSAAADDTYKVAILTGTNAQGEDELRAAVRQQAADPAHIIIDTYPDQFMAEQENTIAKLVAFASDPEVKAIIMCQAVPGATAAFEKIREMGRDDILLVAGDPMEDSAGIAAVADIVLYADEAYQGATIMKICDNWGIDVFVHYSFPRHMAREMVTARHDVLKADAEAQGIEFRSVAIPDPAGEAGLAATRQFILDDVPQQMVNFAGKKVAFFTSYCDLQEALQTAILTQKNAYYPQPCCPSPYNAFPAVLGLTYELGDDATEALQAIAEKLAQYDAVGRFSTCAAPVNMAMIDVAVDYAHRYIAGDITSRNDAEALSSIFGEKLGGATISNYRIANGEELVNYYVIQLAPIDFSDYL